MKVNSVSNNQNFGGVTKLIVKAARSTETMFVSPSGDTIGQHIVRNGGAVQGWRKFKGGERIDYTTVLLADKAGKQKSVAYTYRFPDGKGAFLRRWFVFDLNKFKEHLAELTSLKGIKRYLAEVERAPKTTKFEPCC